MNISDSFDWFLYLKLLQTILHIIQKNLKTIVTMVWKLFICVVNNIYQLLKENVPIW